MMGLVDKAAEYALVGAVAGFLGVITRILSTLPAVKADLADKRAGGYFTFFLGLVSTGATAGLATMLIMIGVLGNFYVAAGAAVLAGRAGDLAITFLTRQALLGAARLSSAHELRKDEQEQTGQGG